MVSIVFRAELTPVDEPAACHSPKREPRGLAAVCRCTAGSISSIRLNRRYRSGDAPPSFVAGKRNTSRLSILITVSRPAECACLMRRNPASVSSIIPSSWTTKSRLGSSGRQSGMALARLKSKCVQGATTEVSKDSFGFRHSSRAGGLSTSPIFVELRPHTRLLCF
jgi:hypothetical protein